MLKKLLFAVAVCCTLCGWGNAETLSVNILGLDWLLPFQETNASQLYSFEEGRGFAAIETNLAKRGDGALVFGGATSTAGSPAFPYIGVNIRLPSPPFDISDNELTFGPWIGRDSGAKETFWGVKASLGLF